ncbi:nucleotide disphospho-sugar-binding domain-containing protein [Streptomyces pseudovenezuelae]|uniref:UDP:flavonoid glycosyltransferase YjiC (YdhE family) n=1 Tax=Streptomyces pseudovenezuelae TaxID=67350 RepID=A0ABT6LP32_9ACTN|nr:nucleotide disphospho-sugar-binding domain-containing protein [Streptomyces pseudovenezuelae]MDH6218064.1 UDP:flavonoid glycosyltransferase YjiC (YdhE family) [Streptomyces pseudovenezuelae]
MAKIIVAAPPITGELSPLLQLARGLAARGHQITVVTGSRFREDVEKSGLAFVPVTGLADFDDRLFGEDPERMKLAPGPDMLNYDWKHAFVNPLPEQHAVLQQLLEQDPDQYLISNVLWLGAVPTAMGAPGLRPRRWVGVTAVPLALSSDDTTFFGPAPVAPGDDQKAANRAGNAQFAMMMQPTQDRLADVLHSLGATETFPVFVDGVATVPDATAALTVPGFEFERGDAPDSVHLVGILPGRSAPEWEPPSWWAELDGSRPVVVVTQGTLANRDLSELVEPTLTGLADLDVTVVAALGREVDALSIPVPANARVAEFIPFDVLLPKADLYITNGGNGGTQQAIAAGVPVIAAGLTEDKPAVAARVAHHGLGIDLETATPTPEAVAQAAELALKDVEMRDNVRRLAQVYAEHDALGEIERLTLG